MKLVYVCADRGVHVGGTKGAAVHVHEVSAALASAGADVVLAAASVVDGSAPSGVTIALLPPQPAREEWLDRLIAAQRPFAVYERFSLHATAGSRAARTAGIPHLVELNAPLLDEATRYRTLDRPEQAAAAEVEVLSNASIVIAVSRSIADYARSRGAHRVEVMPNAVAPDRFRLAATHDDRVAPVAVLAGNLRAWHGPEVVVDAWRRLGDDAPELMVVGDGHGRSELEAVGATVTGPLPHDDVPSLLARSHIGLVPYAADAPRYFSPLKLFEYLAAGLAAVVSDLPGVVDVVDDSTAVVVPAGDPLALADAVRSLVRHPARRARLGAAGRAHVLAHHTWTIRADRILELALEVSGSSVA